MYVDHGYTYEYDGNGNIKSKKTYAYTTDTLGSVEDTVTYSYGNSDWKDLLTSYDGTAISYDASGNPLNWNDERTITWVGRQLDSIMSPDGARWAFKYDHNGLRTEREYSYSGEVILRSEYTWVDEKLVKEERRDGMNTLLITLEYFYNGEDLIGFSIQEGDAAAVNYYYGKTNNGEIRFIYDANGEIVTTYLYDAWGAPISMSGSLASTVGATNPFRYKSYYYDSETRLYYLRSRSYDPAVGRFLNADAVEYLGKSQIVLSYNLFVYCYNNPIQEEDLRGTAPLYLVGAGIQIEVNIGPITLGFEVVWFFSSRVDVGGRNRAIPWVYLYGGGGVGLSANTRKILKSIISKPSLLFNPKSLLGGFSLSVCVFAVFGYSDFTSYRDYLERFDGVYSSVWHVKTYTSWSDSCLVVGVGWSSAFASAGYSNTYYWLSNEVFSNIAKLYNMVTKKAKSIKR